MDDNKIQVLIADDSQSFRIGMRSLFKITPDIVLVGEAENGRSTIRMAEDLQPDVILMDLQMPDINGIEAAREITHTSPHIGILMLTMFDDDDSIFAAMRAGARGYILKGASKNEIIRAIQDVGAGAAIFSPDIARRMMVYFNQMQARGIEFAFPDLTEREREILILIADHRSNQEIAAELVLSPKTVRNYVSNILSKLQVADRAEAIIRARDAGI